MENLVPPLKRGARGDLHVSRENLTPQPPSLRGKGEHESPSPLRGGVGEGSEFANTSRGKGEHESPSPLRGGVGEGSFSGKAPHAKASYWEAGLLHWWIN